MRCDERHISCLFLLYEFSFDVRVNIFVRVSESRVSSFRGVFSVFLIFGDFFGAASFSFRVHVHAEMQNGWRILYSSSLDCQHFYNSSHHDGDLLEDAE